MPAIDMREAAREEAVQFSVKKSTLIPIGRFNAQGQFNPPLHTEPKWN
jgi:hypothetical protein